MRNNGTVNEQAKHRALRLYEQACQKNWWTTVRSLFDSGAQRLLHMEEFRAACTVVSDRHAGVESASIAHIRGSVNEGRTYDFDADFRPLKRHNRERWLRLAEACQRGVRIPPVKLIKIGEIYFVQDGHHRISVHRAMGLTEIQADVTVWQTSGPLPWQEQPSASMSPARRLSWSHSG